MKMIKLKLLLSLMMATITQAAVSSGDVLIISIKGVPQDEQVQFSGNYPVSPEGNIHLPHLQGMSAAGSSTSALARKIEAAYKASEIYRNPTISIQSANDTAITEQGIDQKLAKFITVSGKVGAPGSKPYRPGMTLIDAVSQAAPTAFAAQKRVELLRNGKITKYNMEIPEHMMIRVLPNDTITLQEKDWRGQ